MKKAELVGAVADKTGLSKKDAELACNAFTDAITEALVKGDKVALVGFGTFSVKERPERQGINPATMEKITNKAGYLRI